MIDPVTPRIEGAHHVAFRCFDAEQTRAFYADLIGLDLAAAIEFETVPGSDERLRYMHLFFRMTDGRYVAFFDLPDNLHPNQFKPRSGFHQHLALEVDSVEAVMQFKDRLVAYGCDVDGPLDHGFVTSIYTYDPNGIQVEITTRSQGYAEIMRREREIAAANIKSWTIQTAAAKEAFIEPAAAPGPAS